MMLYNVLARETHYQGLKMAALGRSLCAVLTVVFGTDTAEFGVPSPARAV